MNMYERKTVTKLKKLTLFLALTGLVGCATAPQTEDVPDATYRSLSAERVLFIGCYAEGVIDAKEAADFLWANDQAIQAWRRIDADRFNVYVKQMYDDFIPERHCTQVKLTGYKRVREVEAYLQTQTEIYRQQQEERRHREKLNQDSWNAYMGTLRPSSCTTVGTQTLCN
ncbi:hypothetical protein [Bacterioplanoides pacificum]|uniref:Lipoprotein n=1 Tax=Bacterioplanoides pacificum TaxID=1171596 RepID=A0ABV7VR70_9GAMM